MDPPCVDIITEIASHLSYTDKTTMYKTMIESNHEQDFFRYEYARIMRRKNTNIKRIKACSVIQKWWRNDSGYGPHAYLYWKYIERQCQICGNQYEAERIDCPAC